MSTSYRQPTDSGASADGPSRLLAQRVPSTGPQRTECRPDVW